MKPRSILVSATNRVHSLRRAALGTLAGLSLALVMSSNAIAGPTPTPPCDPNTFKATLTGSQEVPPNDSEATGTGVVALNDYQTMIEVTVNFSGLSGNASAAHIHGPALPGVSAPVLIGFPNFPATTSGTYTNTFAITPEQVSWLNDGLLYINIHTAMFPSGEIRGPLESDCDVTPTCRRCRLHRI